MIWYLPQCKGYCTLWRKQTLKKRQEVQALQHCQTGPSPLLDEEKKKLKALYRTNGWDWESGDQLFLTRLLPVPSEEAIQALATTSQWLAKGAQQSAEMQVISAPLPLYARGFGFMFAKNDFDVLPEHWHWDHAIELIPGSKPKSTKVYSLSSIEQKELDAFLQENLHTKWICLSKLPMAAPVFFIKKKDSCHKLPWLWQISYK